jgi:tetrahydromethanopterin S-methyltransferase subunit G
MTVDLALADSGTPNSVTPVSEADIAKEKLSQLGGQGSKVARAVLQNVGRDIAIAYAVFLVGALFFSVVSAAGLFSGVSITLADLLSGKLGLGGLMGGGSGKGTFLVLLATATIAVPYFWKHIYSPLAFCAPLLFTLYAFYPVWQQYSQAKEQAQQAGAFFGEAVKEMSSGFSLGIGAYLTIAAGLYLAFRGVVRFLGRQNNGT